MAVGHGADQWLLDEGNKGKKWLNGKLGTIVCLANRGGWKVTVWDQRGNMSTEVDVPAQLLARTMRRGWLTGDAVSVTEAGGCVLEAVLAVGPWAEEEGDAAMWEVAAGSDGGAHTVPEALLRRRASKEATGRRRASKRRAAAGGEAERLTAEVQRAYRAAQDWAVGAIRPLVKAQTGWEDVDNGKLAAAVKEAKRRWVAGEPEFQAITLNHGGMLVRMREAVDQRQSLRRNAAAHMDIDDTAFVWQAGSRLLRTLRGCSLKADMVVVQESHVCGQDQGVVDRLRGLLTRGEFEGWRLVEGHVPARGSWAGVLVWYNTAVCALDEEAWTAADKTAGGREGEVLVAGRVLRARVRVLADGTEFDMVNAYMPPNQGGATPVARLVELAATRAALQQAAQEAAKAGRELAVAGDLQGQTRRAREEMGVAAQDGRGSAFDVARRVPDDVWTGERWGRGANLRGEGARRLGGADGH